MIAATVHEPATAERWRHAQEAEREFWADVATAPATVGAIVQSLSRTAQWARERVPVDAGSEWVEIGIGPLGLGVSHFLRAGPGRPRIIGLDPIALDERGTPLLADPLASLVEHCRSGYQHVVARGERTGLAAGRFSVAFLHNMLDHVEAPADVLSETRRLLSPRGHLVLTCDVFSVIGILKHEHWNRRRRADSILVRAHPHRFSYQELVTLISRAGFAVAATSYVNSGWQRVGGRVQEVYIHAVAR
jgi:SAM-dependent methyltransferase